MFQNYLCTPFLRTSFAMGKYNFLVHVTGIGSDPVKPFLTCFNMGADPIKAVTMHSSSNLKNSRPTLSYPRQCCHSFVSRSEQEFKPFPIFADPMSTSSWPRCQPQQSSESVEGIVWLQSAYLRHSTGQFLRPIVRTRHWY